MDERDLLLQQAIGELKESNRAIASSLNSIKDNLKTLNDHNILHTEKTNLEHEKILEKIMVLTGKYWYLIIGLLSIILIIMGYKDALTHLF